MGPFPRLMINPECCYTTRPAFTFTFCVIWLASILLSLIDIMLQVLLWPMLEVMLEVDDLKGRSMNWLHIVGSLLIIIGCTKNLNNPNESKI